MSRAEHLRRALDGVERAVSEMLRCPSEHCSSCRDALGVVHEIVRDSLRDTEAATSSASPD